MCISMQLLYELSVKLNPLFINKIAIVLETYYSGDTILLIFPDGTGPALLSSLIAGIPLNRVHEVQYSPGEIRLDVTYESVISSMNKYALNYDENYGIAELQALRDKEKIQIMTDVGVPTPEKKLANKPAEIVSAKTKLRSSGAVKKSTIREKREKLAGSPVETSPIDANKYRDAREIMAMGFFSLFGMGGASMVRLDSKKKEPVSDEKLKIWMKDDSQAKPCAKVEFHKTKPSQRKILNPDDIKAPELIEMEQKIIDAPFKVPEMEEHKERAERAAQKAMEQYLDQDDGADAWLDSMTVLANEE